MTTGLGQYGWIGIIAIVTLRDGAKRQCGIGGRLREIIGNGDRLTAALDIAAEPVAASTQDQRATPLLA